jgi:hypothetical protein
MTESDGAGNSTSRLREINFFQNIFTKPGIFEIERESRYRESSSEAP